MTKTEVMKKLKAMGTAQNRKVYARHGVQGKMFGVSYANFGLLKKQIKTDQKLAVSLWSTGNFDARVLAAMIADPGQLDRKTLESWVKDTDSYGVCYAIAPLARSTSYGRSLAEKWRKSRNEWIATTGWQILAGLVGDGESYSTDELDALLAEIEEKIHTSKNRVRYEMNAAVIGIGLVNAAFQKKAIAAAKRIGPVEVDHGETGCKTPDAIAMIKKAAAHRAKKKAKAKAKKKAVKKTAKKATKKKVAKKKATSKK